MGVRGEIFSTKVALQNRTYFFNVKENRMGDLYLNIVESKNRETGGFDRQSLVLFADDLQEFLGGFDESLRVLEKAVREQRKTARSKPAPGSRETPTGDRPKGAQRTSTKRAYSGGGSKRPDRRDDGSAQANRRMVVKRKKKSPPYP